MQTMMTGYGLALLDGISAATFHFFVDLSAT